jgi:hypothetical protein
MRLVQILVTAVTLGLLAGYAWSAMPHRLAVAAPAAAEPAAASAPAKPSPEEIEHSAYYPDCAAARASGNAPIFRGQAGYRSALDADGDGIACEPYRG